MKIPFWTAIKLILAGVKKIKDKDIKKELAKFYNIKVIINDEMVLNASYIHNSNKCPLCKSNITDDNVWYKQIKYSNRPEELDK